MIVFTVPGEPQGPGRQRLNNYTRRQESDAPPFLELLKLYATQHKPETPWTEAIVLDLLIYRSAPGGITKQVRGKKARNYLAERLRPLTRPTAEMYARSVLDVLEGIIWQNDGQVVDLRVRKYYSEHPRLVIRARLLADLHPNLMNHPEWEQDWMTGPPDWIGDELTEWENEQEAEERERKRKRRLAGPADQL